MPSDKALKRTIPKFFVSHRCGAAEWTIYRDGNFQSGFRPTIGGQGVTLGIDLPPYATRALAIKAAQEYKDKCKKYLAEKS